MDINFILILTIFLFGLISVVVLVAAFFLLSRRIKKGAMESKSVGSVLLEIRVPKENEFEIQAADQMFASLHGIGTGGLNFITKHFKAIPYMSFEIVGFPESIRFYVHVPENLRTMIEKQIHGAYPTAEVTLADEYNIFSEEGRVAFGELKLDSKPYEPVMTYEELSSDGVSGITSTMSKLAEGEGAALQLVINPVGGGWSKQGRSYVNNVKANNADPEKPKMKVSDDVLEGIDKKCAKMGFNLVLRIVCVGNSVESAKAHLENIKSAFQQFSRPGLNSFTTKKLKIWDRKMFPKRFLYRLPGKGSVLNSAELATIYHLPNKDVQTPHIHWLMSKRAPASAEVPSQGGLWLGTSIYRDVSKNVHIKEDDQRRHMYIVGKTGTGKSFFLQSMILQDIRAGKGIAFLDPHGDSAEWILERIPAERAEDVIYFNPADIERPVGFNMIEAYDENDKHRIVNSFVGMMYKMFDPNRQGIVGPRFERAVRNAMLTAMSEEGNTLVEVMRILTDPSFVKQKLPFVKDEMVRRFWTDEQAQTSEFHKSEVLGYIVSKFDRFVTNKLMRNIIGQSRSTFDFRKVMDEGKILIVNLSKGEVGEENSQFLGLLLVPRILASAMSRANIPAEQRRDFYLYVDEFQNFATEDFAQILSEARKYRLNLIVANQYISQIEQKVRDAVFGNVGSIVSFKVGVTDAEYLQHEFEPIFSQTDLINLENRNAYVKLLVDGEYPAPFSMTTDYKYAPFPIPDANLQVAQMIKQLSRLRYGRDKAIVEAEINKRAQLTGPPARPQRYGGFGGGGGRGQFAPKPGF